MENGKNGKKVIISAQTSVELSIVSEQILERQNTTLRAEAHYLYHACSRNDLDVAWHIISQSETSPFFPVVQGRSPFMAAIEGGCEEMVSMLLSIGFTYKDEPKALAELKQATDPYGNSPLHFASRRNNQKILQILLEDGSFKMSVRNNAGLTPAQFSHNRPKYDRVAA